MARVSSLPVFHKQSFGNASLLRGACLVMYLVLFSGVVVHVTGEDRTGFCCLCARCAVPVWHSHFVDSFGTTCGAIWLEMADSSNDSTPGSVDCLEKKAIYRTMCCEADEPPNIVQAPTAPPGSEYPEGNHAYCDLCHDGGYPTRPHTIAAILDMPGNPTCKDLYYLGRRGNIKEALCNPLQDYYHEPCGCEHQTNQAPIQGDDEIMDNDEDELVLPPKMDVTMFDDDDIDIDAMKNGGGGYVRGGLGRSLVQAAESIATRLPQKQDDYKAFPLGRTLNTLLSAMASIPAIRGRGK